MKQYILRRIIYAIPVLIGVNLITFILFFMVNTPDDMARMHLGGKHLTQTQIDNWKDQHGYNKPLFFNPEGVTQTLFYQKSLLRVYIPQDL